MTKITLLKALSIVFFIGGFVIVSSLIGDLLAIGFVMIIVGDKTISLFLELEALNRQEDQNLEQLKKMKEILEQVKNK